MLKLAQKIAESIIIDDDIRVIVLSEQSGQVKLGIEARDGIEIWCEEIYEKIQSEIG